ncbi:alpha/beta hydrolase family esterase [Nocardia rhizosphaerihabitans]|uniref:extracellular catalytic domain type 1 short-chain-length polyhydroxyalkanoate depolymerase n=1 Tax=Nocardia rhizosphaerihabitans TaxID=1691570 RepID=UPI00366AAD81
MRIALLAAAAATVVFVVVGIVAVRDDPGPAVAGTTEQVLEHDGRTRHYRVYRPAALPARPPLVVVLHGGLGTGEQAQRAYGWDALADAGGFVVAYPDGLDRAWNAGGCCGNPARTGVDDVGFLTRMIDELVRTVSIDRDRIYLTGMSNGAMMAYSMACRTSIAAAVGAVAGTLLDDCPHPSPTSVIHVHGTDDENVRYDGAPGSGVARIDGPSVPELNEFWRAADDCAPPVSTIDDRVTTLRASCRDGRAVDLVTVAGAGHRWPGAELSPLERLDPNRRPDALDATRLIWDFFAAHHR